MKVDLSAEVRVIKNKKATETQELDRFGPSAQRNTVYTKIWRRTQELVDFQDCAN